MFGIINTLSVLLKSICQAVNKFGTSLIDRQVCPLVIRNIGCWVSIKTSNRPQISCGGINVRCKISVEKNRQMIFKPIKLIADGHSWDITQWSHRGLWVTAGGDGSDQFSVSSLCVIVVCY